MRNAKLGLGKSLTGNTGGDDNDVGPGQGVLEAIILGEVAGDFLYTR
jgi:hypothetical protein